MNRPLFALSGQYSIGLSLLLVLSAGDCLAALEDFSEESVIQDVPVVLSASRLRQPLSEAPNAMTVIDRNMIVASGFRSITDLFKLVPGMYVSYYKGSQAIISYHGSTDGSSRRMQVMIDGRSVYLPPSNLVDWADLPITIDDIERVEVIRGPAAASYGANSTQGVINIITKDAGTIDGKSLKYTHGSKGINDASARFGQRGETFDYRMTLGYTADNGYDDLTVTPNNMPPRQSLLNNSNDSNQARLMNFRGNYHPNTTDSVDLQFGFNHDVQGVGFQDKNPSPTNPTGTNGDPFHNLFANASFMQLGWTHLLENASELNLHYYHIQVNQHEALPVYLHGVYYPGPVYQSQVVGRDQLEAQHTLSTSESNRLVYGAHFQRNSTNGQSNMPPLSLYLSSTSNTEDFQIFANDEWRVNSQLLFNIGGMYEKEDYGNKNLSPRTSLNFHMTPHHTLRIGTSVAYRTPALGEMTYPAVQPGFLSIPSSTVTSPGLVPEKLVSKEIGYIGEFPEWNTLLDLRVFDDHLSNGIVINTNTLTLRNDLTADYHGFEATLKTTWDKTSNLTLNFARESANSNGPALVAAGNPYLISQSPVSNDILAASIPNNSASLLFSQRLPSEYSFSTAYYFQASLQPFDRGSIDYQPTQHRVDVRIAKELNDVDGMKCEVALVVQDFFNTPYTEYVASNLFNQRAYITLTLH